MLPVASPLDRKWVTQILQEPNWTIQANRNNRQKHETQECGVHRRHAFWHNASDSALRFLSNHISNSQQPLLLTAFFALALHATFMSYELAVMSTGQPMPLSKTKMPHVGGHKTFCKVRCLKKPVRSTLEDARAKRALSSSIYIYICVYSNPLNKKPLKRIERKPFKRIGIP